MAVGFEALNEGYSHIVSQDGYALTFEKGQKFSLPGGYRTNNSFAQLGNNTTIPAEYNSGLVAIQSNTWVAQGRARLRQPPGVAAGTARLFKFHQGNTGVYPGNLGLQVFDANGVLKFSSAWGVMKVLEYVNLPQSWRGNWSYTAPAGRQIALAVGGGMYTVVWDRSGEDLYDGVFMRTVNNTAYVSFMEDGWAWVSDEPGDGRLWSVNSNLRILVVDVTDLMRFVP